MMFIQITVRIGKEILNSEYTVNYISNSKKIGEYNVKIIYNNEISNGEVTLKYKILPKETKISKIKSQKKKMTVQWKKQKDETTGYEIQYSTKSDFSSTNKKVKINTNKTTSTAVNKLKSKKKYYVRIRTFKKVKGKTYYSSWSKTKSIKIK